MTLIPISFATTAAALAGIMFGHDNAPAGMACLVIALACIVSLAVAK